MQPIAGGGGGTARATTRARASLTSTNNKSFSPIIVIVNGWRVSTARRTLVGVGEEFGLRDEDGPRRVRRWRQGLTVPRAFYDVVQDREPALGGGRPEAVAEAVVPQHGVARTPGDVAEATAFP